MSSEDMRAKATKTRIQSFTVPRKGYAKRGSNRQIIKQSCFKVT